MVMGRTIGSVNGPNSKIKPRLFLTLTSAQKAEILNEKRKGTSNKVLAQKFGVTEGVMRCCVRELNGLSGRTHLEPSVVNSRSNEITKLLGNPKKIEKAMDAAIAVGASPLQAANALMNIVDQLAISGVEALREQHDPRYRGLDDLGLGYSTVDPESSSRGSKWMRSAIAEDQWSPKEVTQILMMAIKNRMDMAPYVHPKVGNVEPAKKDFKLENLTPAERRQKLKDLGEKLGLKITDNE
jgi:hypothetical protein